MNEQLRKEVVDLQKKLDQHIQDEVFYRKTLDDKLDPILDAINAGKLSYRFILGFLGFVASILGVLHLYRIMK